MARWQSKAHIEEQEYQKLYREKYPELEQLMQAFVASYDANQPIQEHEQTHARYPISLLTSRMAKQVVWPKVRTYEISTGFRGRLVSESIDRFAKPLRDAEHVKQRQQEKDRQAAFKLASASRKVVEVGTFSSSMTPGEVGIITSKNGPDRVLTCLTCEFVRAPRDMGQDDDGYVIELAEPIDEEKATEAYQRAAKKVADDIACEKERQERFEHRRQAELDAIRARGEEPDLFDEIFAGTSDY